jgi:hypothetical protein
MATAAGATERRDALVERLFMDAIGAFDLFSAYVGDVLGLYRALADKGPAHVSGARGARGHPRAIRAKVDRDGGHKDPISPFVAADDYDETREMVAIIRGKGETGRQMYSPGDQLPPPYRDLKVEVLGDRIKGHYHKCCVLAREDDTETMLRHGAARLRLRGG